MQYMLRAILRVIGNVTGHAIVLSKDCKVGFIDIDCGDFYIYMLYADMCSKSEVAGGFLCIISLWNEIVLRPSLHDRVCGELDG
jgi:hypothetical protein